MPAGSRKFSLDIWALGFGYFVFYTPYSALTKAISNGLLSGDGKAVPGPELLPVAVMATVVTMFAIITVAGWWKYAGRRRFFGQSLPFPNQWTFLSGLCIAVIIGTTTLAFSFGGISIIFVLVLLRGGILILGPIVDVTLKRRVRWFSWAALGLSLLSLLVILADVANYTLTLFAIANIAAYLLAYFFRLRLMTRLAKTADTNLTMRYFVEEQIVATPVLLLLLAALAWFGSGELPLAFREGFGIFFRSDIGLPTFLVGASYAALCVCTTLIFLDRRENTFCVPMHCGSSMLSGVVASWVLMMLYGQAPPSLAQLASAALIVIALLFLSPLHHLRLYSDRLTGGLGSKALPQLAVAGLDKEDIPPALSPDHQSFAKAASENLRRRMILFVCSGNTCRSAMAEAIAKAETARRFKVPYADLGDLGFEVLSAGVSASPGRPMTEEAQVALRQLEVPVPAHQTRVLTPEMVQQAEVIYCLARAHRQAVIARYPAAAGKTLCLDDHNDIEDPIGAGLELFLSCARRIQELICLRFDELGLQPNYSGPWQTEL